MGVVAEGEPRDRDPWELCGPQGENQGTEGHSQAWKPRGTCSARFQIHLGPVTSVFLPCSPDPCILKAGNLFSSFTGPQMERHFVPGRIIPLVPMLNQEV